MVFVIVGTGCDIVRTARVERLLTHHPDRFLKRCFYGEELVRLQSLHPSRKAEFCAARIAAKEAFVKALGTGFARGVFWRDVEVCAYKSGAPFLRLHGQAYSLFVQKATIAHTSLSHDHAYAMAFVVLENSHDRAFSDQASDLKEKVC